MEKIIGYCGITCSECPAYVATQNNDQQKREETALIWSKEFGQAIKPKDINCDGCLTKQGRLFQYCAVCNIRKCTQARQITNCAHCPEFACHELNHILNAVPKAKKTIQAIKDSL